MKGTVKIWFGEAAARRRFLFWVLAAEAVVCVVLYMTQMSFAGVFPTVMAFPFEQIGFGLRALSLSGGPGNVAAIAVYVAFCLLPAAVLLALRKRRKFCGEDWLLALLCAVLFAVMYLMVNPGLIGVPLGGAAGSAGWAGATGMSGAAGIAGTAGTAIGKAMLGGLVYSILCGYFVLRLLRLFFFSTNVKLAGYMAVFLCLLNVLFVYLVFGACFGALLDSVRSLQAGNIGNENLLGASYVFLGLQFVVDALPYVLDVVIAFAAIRLLDELRADRYSAGAVAAVGRVSQLCAAALTTIVLSNIGFNLLQFLFSKSVMFINVSVDIPVLSIAFVLAALLLTRFVTDNKRLKDDNDMFI